MLAMFGPNQIFSCQSTPGSDQTAGLKVWQKDVVLVRIKQNKGPGPFAASKCVS